MRSYRSTRDSYSWNCRSCFEGPGPSAVCSAFRRTYTRPYRDQYRYVAMPCDGGEKEREGVAHLPLGPVLHESDPEPVAQDVVRDVGDGAVRIVAAPLAEQLVRGLDRVQDDDLPGPQLDADDLAVLGGPFADLSVNMWGFVSRVVGMGRGRTFGWGRRAGSCRMLPMIGRPGGPGGSLRRDDLSVGLSVR